MIGERAHVLLGGPRTGTVVMMASAWREPIMHNEMHLWPMQWLTGPRHMAVVTFYSRRLLAGNNVYWVAQPDTGMPSAETAYALLALRGVDLDRVREVLTPLDEAKL